MRPSTIVDATEILTYHNLTGQARPFSVPSLSKCFSTEATFVRETNVQRGSDDPYEKWEDKDNGSEEIKSLEVVGQGI